MNNKMKGALTTLIGIIGAIFSYTTIKADMTPYGLFGTHYTYKAPYTDHETMMIIVAIASGIFILVGIALLCCGNESNNGNNGSNNTMDDNANNNGDSVEQ